MSKLIVITYRKEGKKEGREEEGKDVSTFRSNIQHMKVIRSLTIIQ
jgi:hypothetical protein